MEKKKILLVDDEEAFGRMVKLNLEKTGEYEVKIETKGAQALDSVKEFRPDLILLDIVMPDVDGAEIARQIESEEALKNIPLVFLTAIAKEDEVVSEGGIIGGYPFIAKPVTTEKLIDSIKRNIIRKR